MGIVESYLIPICYATIGIAMIGFFCYGAYRLARKILPKELNSWVKFKLMRKEMPEKDVLWCDAAYENGADIIDVKKTLRINGVDEERIDDTVYIFREITKLKGGLKSNERQIKRHSLKEFKGKRRGEEEESEKA